MCSTIILLAIRKVVFMTHKSEDLRLLHITGVMQRVKNYELISL